MKALVIQRALNYVVCDKRVVKISARLDILYLLDVSCWMDIRFPCIANFVAINPDGYNKNDLNYAIENRSTFDRFLGRI